MKTYPLLAYKKGGTYLIPTSTWNTDEYLREHNDLCLQEHLVNDGHGNMQRRYRLFSRNYMRFADTLEYDIKCPHCNNKLRLCGNPVDANYHGLYKCRVCDNERSAR